MEFDFTRPIVDTRDEVFLIKLSGCIKNVGEMLYRAALKQPNFKSYWLEKYPKFIELSGKTDEDVFALLAPFTGPEFLKWMSATKSSYTHRDTNSVIQDYATLRAYANPYDCISTNIEFMLNNLSTYDFCKKIYIWEPAFTELSKKFLQDLFRATPNKVALIESPLNKIIEAKPEITTIFSDSAAEVCDAIQAFPEEENRFKDKCFMISALPNIENPTSKDNFYKYQKFLSELRPRFGCEARWFQIKPVTKFDTPSNRQYTI